MSDLIAFLRARLDEDEEYVEAFCITGSLLRVDYKPTSGDRVLAEVQVKRAILDLHSDHYAPERAAGIPDDVLPEPGGPAR